MKIDLSNTDVRALLQDAGSESVETICKGFWDSVQRYNLTHLQAMAVVMHLKAKLETVGALELFGRTQDG